MPLLFFVLTTFLAYLAGTAVNWVTAAPMMPAPGYPQEMYDAGLRDFHRRHPFVAPLAALDYYYHRHSLAAPKP